MADTTTSPAVAADPATAAAPPSRRHLHDVDVVRFTTVLGVLCVHGTSLMLSNTETSGAALALLHVTREVFLFLSAFVLAYSTKLPVVPVRFWRRRFPLVLAPYLVWSAIYVVADGNLDSPTGVLARYGRDILSGAARFHLYFLLLTFQLYVIFPWLRTLLAKTSRHARILVGAITFQLVFTACIHYRADIPVLNTWLTHPGTWLPSYLLYVVAGVLAALHFDAVRAWVGERRRKIAVAFVLVFATGLGSYLLDVHLAHFGFIHAGEVFSPAVVVEAGAAILAQFALGLWVAGRAGPRVKRALETSSDVSFGVYLAHPLLYQGFLDLLRHYGVHGLTGLPSGAGVALLVCVIAPATYLLTAGAIWLVRRTALSLALTGRRYRRQPRPDRSPPVLASAGS